MKVVILVFLCLILSVVAEHKHRGCQYVLGRCLYECPEGTHSYGGSCSTTTWSEKTCKDPVPRDMGKLCDYSRCECDEPNVKDEANNKCVKLEDCPKAEETTE